MHTFKRIRTWCLPVLVLTPSFSLFANTLTDVGLGPVPAYDPDQGTEWTLSSSCIDINDSGEAACQTQAVGPVYGCGFRNAQNCSSKVKLVHKWNGNSLVMMSSPDAGYDVPLVMNNNGEIGGYAYVGEVYPSAGGNGRIWSQPGAPEAKASIVRSLNDAGDFVLEWFDNPGGIASYTSSAYRSDGTEISYPGEFVRPFVIGNGDHVIGAQIIQNYMHELHSPTGNEIPEISGVGWLLDQQQIDALPLNESGLFDMDGEILWPAPFYRPIGFTDYETSVNDVNAVGEFTVQMRFGGLVSSRFCSPHSESTITDIFGTEHTVPWVCELSNYSGGTYAGGKVFNGVNDFGDMVGSFTPGAYEYQTSYPTHPWVWLKKATRGWDEYNVNDLLPAGSGYEVLWVRDINNSRQIVGDCRNTANDVVTGCILDLADHPVPEKLVKPLVSIDSPLPAPAGANATGYSDVVKIAATAWDRDGSIEKVVFKIGDTRIRTDRKPPYKASWDTSQFAAGTHTLRVIAIDNDGNRRIRKMDLTVATPDQPPTSEPVEGEGVITSVGDGYIGIDGVITHYDDSTRIQFNDVSDFAIGLPVQYKGVLQDDGSILASDLEVN